MTAGDPLAPLRASLAADGYELVIAEGEGDSIVCTVASGPDVCDDCLVPKSVVGSLVADALGIHEQRVIVHYPNES